MLNNEEMLAWAESHHWTILVLSERDKTFIPAGEQAWQGWIAQASPSEKAQAQQRITKWQAIVEQKQVSKKARTEQWKH